MRRWPKLCAPGHQKPMLLALIPAAQSVGSGRGSVPQEGHQRLDLLLAQLLASLEQFAGVSRRPIRLRGTHVGHWCHIEGFGGADHRNRHSAQHSGRPGSLTTTTTHAL